jgi:hypothetical protein
MLIWFIPMLITYLSNKLTGQEIYISEALVQRMEDSDTSFPIVLFFNPHPKVDTNKDDLKSLFLG